MAWQKFAPSSYGEHPFAISAAKDDQVVGQAAGGVAEECPGNLPGEPAPRECLLRDTTIGPATKALQNSLSVDSFGARTGNP